MLGISSKVLGSTRTLPFPWHVAGKSWEGGIPSGSPGTQWGWLQNFAVLSASRWSSLKNLISPQSWWCIAQLSHRELRSSSQRNRANLIKSPLICPELYQTDQLSKFSFSQIASFFQNMMFPDINRQNICLGANRDENTVPTLISNKPLRQSWVSHPTLQRQSLSRGRAQIHMWRNDCRCSLKVFHPVSPSQ